MAALKILAIDSSAKAASCAIAEGRSQVALYFQKTGLTHSRTLLPMIEAMLLNCEMTIGDIDLIAVSRGPGSFTGIRIGCATAKGLKWGANIPGCGVSTLEAMAWQASHIEDHIVCSVMDARRSQVYNALFCTSSDKSGKLIRLCPDRAVSIEALGNELKNVEKSVFLIGDGAELCYNILSGFVGDRLVLAPESFRHQNAWGVALAAMGRDKGEYDEPEPVYLRPSQAERERAEREKREKGSADN